MGVLVMAIGAKNRTYPDTKKALKVGLRKVIQYLPKRTLTVTLPSGTLANTKGWIEITTDRGEYLEIRYFKMTTPTNCKGRIVVTSEDGTETWFPEQAVNTTDEIYDAGDWDADFFHIKKFRVYVIANTGLTADESVTCEFSGGVIKDED